MGKYFLKRLAMMVFVVISVSILIFTIMYFTPGDPAETILGSQATDAELAAKRAQLGLDQPFLVQLGNFLGGLYFRLDFGTSYIYSTPVIDELLNRIPYTFALAVACMVLHTIAGIPLGVTAAVHQNGFIDRACMVFAMLGVSVPGFWLALMMVVLFAVKLSWLLAYGIGSVAHFVMPVIAGSVSGVAGQARQMRSSMLDVIRSDYVTTARAKGVEEKKVIYKHALPNALIPVITMLGNEFGRALGGTIVIETVFSIPGVGTYLTTAINNRDYPVVRGCVVILAIWFSFVMVLVDLVYAIVDSRIKAQYAKK